MILSNASRRVVLPYLKLFLVLLSLCVTFTLLTWSLNNYQPAPNFYGPRAIYSLILLSLLLALLGRILLLHMLPYELKTIEVEAKSQRPLHPTTWRPLFLFDITAPIYLAAGVLIGVPAAVLTAIVTQSVLQGYTQLRGFVSWAEGCYRIAATTLLVLIADQVYLWISGPTQNHLVAHFAPLAESREFLGSILAATVMMLLLFLVALPILAQANHTSLKAAWQEYLHSPALRFQLLVLSVGPLLPVVDIFDDIAGELAWLFFLVPLFAIYYLALNSTELSIRTHELQRTLEDLRNARRRQDELRDYASLVTRIQEEERRRLARELHDDTAQALIALSLGLDGLGRAIGGRDLPEKDVQWLASLQSLADRTLEGVRRACRDLRPSILDDLGLRAALEWLSDSSVARGVPCSFKCVGAPQPTTPEAEIAIFRIVQEALSNIWRHANATQAEIELKYQPGFLQVIVLDNGQGLAADFRDIDVARNSQSGLGLVGMRERAMLIGATLKITSSPDRGCSVTLSLPL